MSSPRYWPGQFKTHAVKKHTYSTRLKQKVWGCYPFGLKCLNQTEAAGSSAPLCICLPTNLLPGTNSFEHNTLQAPLPAASQWFFHILEAADLHVWQHWHLVVIYFLQIQSISEAVVGGQRVKRLKIVNKRSWLDHFCWDKWLQRTLCFKFKQNAQVVRHSLNLYCKD